MKKDLHIVASFDQPDLLNSLVEKLAWRRYSNSSAGMVMGETSSFDTSSTETYVSGTLGFCSETGEPGMDINMPFITRFLFTCIKEDNDNCRVTWSGSLS